MGGSGANGLKQRHELTGSYIQHRFFPVDFTGTSVCPKEAKKYDSAFGSVANPSRIHFSLKLLTKPAGSYKQSYHLKVFIKQVVFNVV